VQQQHEKLNSNARATTQRVNFNIVLQAAIEGGEREISFVPFNFPPSGFCG
jgi:hypothetical protein